MAYVLSDSIDEEGGENIAKNFEDTMDNMAMIPGRNDGGGMNAIAAVLDRSPPYEAEPPLSIGPLDESAPDVTERRNDGGGMNAIAAVLDRSPRYEAEPSLSIGPLDELAPDVTESIDDNNRHIRSGRRTNFDNQGYDKRTEPGVEHRRTRQYRSLLTPTNNRQRNESIPANDNRYSLPNPNSLRQLLVTPDEHTQMVSRPQRNYGSTRSRLSRHPNARRPADSPNQPRPPRQSHSPQAADAARQAGVFCNCCACPRGQDNEAAQPATRQPQYRGL